MENYFGQLLQKFEKINKLQAEKKQIKSKIEEKKLLN